MTATHAAPLPYPFNPEAGIDLGEGYETALKTGGLVWVQLPYGEPAWLATRYADARLVLADKRFSRSVAFERDSPRFSPAKVEPTMIQRDAPDHTRLRVLVAKAFTMRRVEDLRPKIRALAERLLDDAIAAGGEMELVEDYALPIPVAAICGMLGVPKADQPQFRTWNDSLMDLGSGTAEEIGALLEEMLGYVGGLVAARRAEPQDDLISALTQARDAQETLTERELVDICLTLLAAGHETTASQISNFTYLLLEDRDRWDALVADPELIPAAVEELMRYVPIATGAMFPHYATEDVEIGGTLVREGEAVLVSNNAASRDELRFPAADSILFDRVDNGHLGFGHGIHHCLGAPLARLQIQEALRALTGKVPTLHRVGDVEWKRQMVARAPRKMPVAW